MSKWRLARTDDPAEYSGDDWILVCFDPKNEPNGIEAQSVGYIDDDGDFIDLMSNGGPVGRSILYWMRFPNPPKERIERSRPKQTVESLLK